MKLEFELIDKGVEHTQYFLGDGVTGTEWDDRIIGCGGSARKAAEDAQEQLIGYEINVGVLDLDRLNKAVEGMPDVEDAHDGCDHAVDEECEWHHHVVLRWKLIRASSDEPITSG